MATALFGLESVVAAELKELGFEIIETRDGRVAFDADEAGIFRANLWLRCAERVYLVVGEFEATDFDTLHESIKRLPWEAYLDKNSKFPVSASSVKSKLFAVPSIRSVAKAAIVAKLRTIYRTEFFSEDGAEHKIQIQLLRDRVSVWIDTSGAGLHKRGYRAYGNKAPIKETLAAGLLRIAARPDDMTLIDPMCGSGTILIEAALMRRNIAPGLQRSFDCEQWGRFNRHLLRHIREEAQNARLPQSESIGKLEGYDIDEASIRQARTNAQKAGVAEDIHFQVRPFAEFSSREKVGAIVTNPPYGERLSDHDRAAELYRTMGEVLSKYPAWSKYIITAHEGFESAFGSKATKHRKLYNGMIKSYYYQYYGVRSNEVRRE